MSNILITGGNGFIGSHITERFLREGESISHPASRELSVLDPQALQAALAGVDTVIHNAAKAVDWGPAEEFQRVNVQGTRNMMEACLAEGVRHVILTGSCSVYGEEHHPGKKDESFPHHSHYPYFLDRLFPCAMNFYRDSKRVAVDEALDFARRNGMNLTVIHPVWVYGERELHTGFYEYLKTVQSGVPILMGSKANTFHVIYAGDLARAYHLAFRASPQGVREYIAGDPEPVSMEELYRTFCRVAGLKKPRNLPKAAVYPAALLLEGLATLRRSKEPPLLTRGRVNMFYDSIAYSGEKLRRELGFSCRFSLEEGVARTVAWYQQEGLL